jgi:uncharacterized protein YgbK (DUF1537 family)
VLTRRQLRRLVESRPVRVVRADALASGSSGSLDDDLADELAHELGAALKDAGPGEVVLVATVLDDAHLCPDPATVAGLPRRLAAVVQQAMTACRPSGLYLTGGDVTGAVLESLGASGLSVDGEVVPLAVTGTLVGGPWAGIPVVTKGGLVGDADTAADCVAALERRVDAPCPAPPGCWTRHRHRPRTTA